ncbi:glycosyl transferase [Adhaeribacter aerolatus]|uniref:Glycosyl transferase n=1 Tax=Adhaeribacter aerolatus TaxID=670289 RepID=A0A512AY31_9BACT|nr:glycosyltransferase [Adhaeribacter aerolatus]GEO04619.1 glycosyl transferase [Adhaeribacter aerolatus]
MKLAIVHDDLMRRGGAEQVARCFHYAFPEAPIFTLCYSPEDTYPDFKGCVVHTSWYQRLVKDEHQMKKLFFPLGVMAMKQLDVTEYEVVLVSSTYCAKYVKVSPKAIVINYCHQPFRLAWFPESYSEYLHTHGLKKMVLKAMIKCLKLIDYQAAQRTDYFIANTAETSQKIKEKYDYKNHIPVIFPPVVADNFQVVENVQDYYLMVTRLEYYKRVDLAIEAFNHLGYKLIIVGKGTKEAELKAAAKDNIIFKNGLSVTELRELYAGCKALVFPQYEDFGITPLEANASGRPVIAFGQGGVLNTMIPYEGNPKRSTAMFFEEQNSESLMDAIETMEKIYAQFDPEFIRKNALRFDETNFIKAIRLFVSDKFRDKHNQPLTAAFNL